MHFFFKNWYLKKTLRIVIDNHKILRKKYSNFINKILALKISIQIEIIIQ